MIFGGLASTRYGTPGATYDIAVVIKKETIPKNFIEILEKEEFRSIEGITDRELLESQYSVFVIGGNEVDFWLNVSGFNFDDDSYEHKSDEKIGDVCVHFISIEDLLASKLAIPVPTESDNIDIVSVLVHHAKNIDIDYFSMRIKQFGLDDKLKGIRQKIIELSKDPKITNLENVIGLLDSICKK